MKMKIEIKCILLSSILYETNCFSRSITFRTVARYREFTNEIFPYHSLVPCKKATEGDNNNNIKNSDDENITNKIDIKDTQKKAAIDSILDEEDYDDAGNQLLEESQTSSSYITSSITPEQDNFADIIPQKTQFAKKTKPRQMDLSWCRKESCGYDPIREKIVGKHNEIIFTSPATGQLMYAWRGVDEDDEDGGRECLYDPSNEGSHLDPAFPSVLILVKHGDDDLMKFASDAVRELTNYGDVTILLSPDVAAKLKYYFGVDSDKIILFDPKPIPGYGTNGPFFDQNPYTPLKSQYKQDSDEFCSNINPDLICTLGGDGLLMYASTLFPRHCPPILCIAGGSLGFLTPFSRDEMVDAIRISLGLDLFYDDPAPKESATVNEENDDFDSSRDQNVVQQDVIFPYLSTVKYGANSPICISMRMRLDCKVVNKEGIVRARYNVLNEVVIDRGSSAYLASLECFCDNVHLTTVQADGIIFSTPTGSTAYSMAAGGSVVHPAVPAILVTPICPHVLSFRSMVFPDHVVLRCYVPHDARSEAAVAFDGKHRRELNRGDSVVIQMSSYPVPTINKDDHSSDWLVSLKRNFNFNTRARQTPIK